MRGSFITTNVTFEELNANCPSANRPSFHPEEVKLDKLPNTNGMATVSETAKTERELCGSIKLTQMVVLSSNSIQKLVDESSTAQYVTNPQLVEGMVNRAIPINIRTQIGLLARGLDLRSEFYLTISKHNRVQLDWTYMSMHNVLKFL